MIRYKSEGHTKFLIVGAEYAGMSLVVFLAQENEATIIDTNKYTHKIIDSNKKIS